MAYEVEVSAEAHVQWDLNTGSQTVACSLAADGYTSQALGVIKNIRLNQQPIVCA